MLPFGTDSACCSALRYKHPRAQQGEASFAIHLLLHKFEAVHLGFRLPVAPFQRQVHLHGRVVSP